jgi:hypothetical protein
MHRDQKKLQRFKDQPLEREKLDRNIAAGRFAPCGSKQPDDAFIAITSREVITSWPTRAEELGKMEITEGCTARCRRIRSAGSALRLPQNARRPDRGRQQEDLQQRDGGQRLSLEK